MFHCVFTQCPQGVELQPVWVWLCSLCLLPSTSSQRPPGCPFLHSNTSASSLQGAVTFQHSPAPPSLIWHSPKDTETWWIILSKGSVKKKTTTLLCSEIIHYTALSWAQASLRLSVPHLSIFFHLVGFWKGRILSVAPFLSTKPENKDLLLFST